jgi:hypothetical protein
MGKRIKAWCKFYNKSAPKSLQFITQAFDLLKPADVEDLARAIIACGFINGLVILDTLNRAASGADENSSVDMSNIIAAAKKLQSLVGGLVLLVHHTGKDATKGLRGHSSLYAALDGAIEVSKSGQRRQWSSSKSKDDISGDVHPFKLHIVDLGIDDDGEKITSCVATADDGEKIIQQVKLPSGGNQKIALNALEESLHNATDFGEGDAPSNHPCLRIDHALSIIADKLIVDAKHKKERAREALTALIAKQVFLAKGEWLWRA